MFLAAQSRQLTVPMEFHAEQRSAELILLEISLERTRTESAGNMDSYYVVGGSPQLTFPAGLRE